MIHCGLGVLLLVLQQPDTVRTRYADVVVVPPDSATARRVGALVDVGYVKLRGYTGYGLNTLMGRIRGNPDVHHPRYLCEVLPPDSMWVKGWRGGLTAWNHSQIARTLVPGLAAESARAGNPAVAILWHELSNGWANVFVDYRGADTNLPWWFASEGHAGFWKQHILTDERLPAEAAREYAVALEHYDRYVKDPSCIERQGAERCDPGAVTHVMLESLWRAHGWTPFRAVYDAVQRGDLLFPKDDDPGRATGALALIMSAAVKRNLIPWMALHHLLPATYGSTVVPRGWPPDTVPTARDLGAAASRRPSGDGDAVHP